jgi:hypothetical protein
MGAWMAHTSHLLLEEPVRWFPVTTYSRTVADDPAVTYKSPSPQMIIHVRDLLQPPTCAGSDASAPVSRDDEDVRCAQSILHVICPNMQG